MSLFGDKIRQSFGFPTQKESMDSYIDNYRLNERNQLAYSMALRSKAISSLNEQIRQLEIVINDNQFFIDTYQTIKSIASEKIKQGSSPIKFSINDPNNKSVIYSNYKSICDFFEALMKKGVPPATMSYYNQKVAEAYNIMWVFYARKIIEGLGILYHNNNPLDESYDIYTAYIKALNFMKSGHLRNEDRKPITLNATNMELIIQLYDYCTRVNNLLSVVLQDLGSRKSILDSEQASEDYIRKTIEDTQKLLLSTREYLMAKRSSEYLETFNKLQ